MNTHLILLLNKKAGFDRMTVRKFTSRTKWNKKEKREKVEYEKLIQE
jgi:ribosomal protein L33